VLQPGDAFSLLCTQPDLAVTVQEVQPGPAHPAAHQPPTLQPSAAADQATRQSSSSLAEAATLDDAGGQMPAEAGTRAHPSQPVVAAAAAIGGGQRTGSMPQARSGTPAAPQQQQQQQQTVARKGMPAGTHPIMLLLVGVPGSGKSTFSQQLQQRSSLPWVRVNQDIVQKKSGKREVCEQQAAAALRSRQCVLIDRCVEGCHKKVPTASQAPRECREEGATAETGAPHGRWQAVCLPGMAALQPSTHRCYALLPGHHVTLAQGCDLTLSDAASFWCTPPPQHTHAARCHVTPDQRQHFIRLARDQGAACHVLVLALPAALCRQRAAGRSQHEGGVQGPGAVRVVGMMQGMFDKAGERSCRATHGDLGLVPCLLSHSLLLNHAVPLMSCGASWGHCMQAAFGRLPINAWSN
jgi:hypothetical protein